MPEVSTQTKGPLTPQFREETMRNINVQTRLRGRNIRLRLNTNVRSIRRLHTLNYSKRTKAKKPIGVVGNKCPYHTRFLKSDKGKFSKNLPPGHLKDRNRRKTKRNVRRKGSNRSKGKRKYFQGVWHLFKKSIRSKYQEFHRKRTTLD